MAIRGRGRLVFAHPSTEQGLELALRAKVDVLAHVIEVAPHWTGATAGRVAGAQVTVIPTLELFHRDPLSSLIGRFVGKTDHIRPLGSFARAGGRIVMGSDAGFLPDYDPAAEYALMARAGLGLRQILASLTSAPAVIVGLAIVVLAGSVSGGRRRMRRRVKG